LKVYYTSKRRNNQSYKINLAFSFDSASLTNRIFGSGNKYSEEDGIGNEKCGHCSVVNSVDGLSVGPIFIYGGDGCVPHTQ
jgi:hypothetical protein